METKGRLCFLDLFVMATIFFISGMQRLLPACQASVTKYATWRLLPGGVRR